MIKKVLVADNRHIDKSSRYLLYFLQYLKFTIFIWLFNFNLKFLFLTLTDPIIDSLNKIKTTHDKLVDKLSSIADFTFKGGNKSYICITTNGKAFGIFSERF